MSDLQKAYDQLMAGETKPESKEWKLRSSLNKSSSPQQASTAFKDQLDQRLEELLKEELLIELGEKPSPLDPAILEMAANSETFAYYLESKLLFGVRFRIWRQLQAVKSPVERFKVGLPVCDMVVSERLELWSAFDSARSKVGSFDFLQSIGGSTRDFELWLRGLRPLDPDEAFLANLEAITTWARTRSAFYKSRETTSTPGQWETKSPLAARFAIYDFRTLALLLRADVSSKATVRYAGPSWLWLIAQRQEGGGQAGEIMEMDLVLRGAFAAACDLVQNAVEIAERHLDLEHLHKPPVDKTGWRCTYDQELAQIHAHRKIRQEATEPGPSNTSCQGGNDYWSIQHRNFDEDAHVPNLVGLAISGGGIRSATFALGVLERLHKMDRLNQTDYLSTVSGGGYIGSWLVANVKRSGYWLGRLTSWNDSIQSLRRNSMYMAPNSGVFSPDTWAIGASYMRNTLLIQVTVIAWLCCILSLTRLTQFLFNGLQQGLNYVHYGLYLLTLLLTYIVQRELVDRSSESPANNLQGRRKDHWWFIWLACFASILTGSLVWSIAKGRTGEDAYFSNILLSAFSSIPLPAKVEYLIGFFLAYGLAAIVSMKEEIGSAKRFFGSLLVSVVCMGTAYLCLCGVVWFFAKLAGHDLKMATWTAYVLGPPMALGALSIGIVMFIGLVGEASPDWRREWWTRYGSYLAMFCSVWLAATGATVFGPYVWMWIFSQHYAISMPALAASAASTIGGLLAGNSARTNGDAKTSSARLEFLAKTGAFVFIVSSVLGISTILHLILCEMTFSSYSIETYWRDFTCMDPGQLLFTTLALFGAAMLFTWRFDLNVFGLNEFYRNRLVRCYLGATRWKAGVRNPNPFTGFDQCDDLQLDTLRYPSENDKIPFRGPFPILNCALNLGGSTDLDVKTRQSASFFFTPFRCGAARPKVGYWEHSINGFKPTLGQAVSISGAAASPNMGFNTSSLVSCLLTVFNVRLGWWYPNGEEASAKTTNFVHRVKVLFQELTGLADESADVLSLSDGGHFENLAIYELIRRKVKVIIAIDGECDPDLTFGSLGNVIRICQTDFNVKIDIDVSSVRKGENGKSRSHCSVGRITYSNGSRGYLVYLKSSISGDEPVSVEQYRVDHPTFPHEATENQFFTDDQFEAYRLLGNHVADSTFRDTKDLKSVLAVAKKLEKLWSPVSPGIKYFTNHGYEFNKIWERLRSSRPLSRLLSELTGAGIGSGGRVMTSDELAACMQLITLMENVFLDLRLEESLAHPDYSGWMKLFETWAKCSTFRQAWKQSGGTYGVRFQHFCGDHLGLPVDTAS